MPIINTPRGAVLELPSGCHTVPLKHEDKFRFRFTVPSSDGMSDYECGQKRDDSTWQCGCPAWIYPRKPRGARESDPMPPRHCKHLKALGLPPADQPLAVVEVRERFSHDARTRPPEVAGFSGTCPRCGFCAEAAQPVLKPQPKRRLYSLREDV
jgi:hypothetical protein